LYIIFLGKLEEILDDRQAEKFSDKMFDVWDDYRTKSQRKKRKVMWIIHCVGEVIHNISYTVSY
jgi:hypothetical protein